MDLGLFGSAVRVGGRTYAVRPPRVYEAIAALSAMAAGDYALVRESVTGWLPVSLVSVLFSRAVDPGECARVIQACLMAGCPEDLATARDDAEERAAALGWASVLAEYRAAYGADPLGEPWPYFLAQLRELPRVQARAMLRFVRSYGAAKVGKDALRSIIAEAGYAGSGVEAPAHLRGEAGRAYAQAKAREYREKMARARKMRGEA